MSFDRLEPLCVRIAVRSLVAFGFLATLGMADAFFEWDLLDPPLQKVAAFGIAWLAMVFGLSAVLAHLLGQRRIADGLGRAAAVARPEAGDRRDAGAGA